MLDVLLDALLDSIKLVPFLFLTYLAMEFLEHKTSSKTKSLVRKSGKAGPLAGAVLGAFPQCGFSAAASNLYAGRVITLGTLIAIYLSTSDEMLPIFLSEKVEPALILSIIGCKVVVGMAAGFVIDALIHLQKGYGNFSVRIGSVCANDKCQCSNGIFRSSLKHTVTVFVYILLITAALNFIIFLVGEDTISELLLNKPIIAPIISAAVGLIPNCASSVVITQLYLGGVLSLGATMAGLLAGSGVGVLVLFKENRNIKENIKIVLLLYFIGVLAGIILDLLI